MNDLDTEPGPYAPPTNILTIIQKQRSMGLPEVLSNQLFLRLGMPQGTLPRIGQSMRFLGLVDDDGRQTEMFQRLRRVSTEEYPDFLAQILKSAYEPIFSILDPSTATEVQLTDAFRQYEPQGQRSRMVTLFLGLCREAGLVTEGPVVRKSPAKKTSTKQDVIPKSKNKIGSVNDLQDQHDSSMGQSSALLGDNANQKYQLLIALINALPQEGKWTQQQRDRWLQAFSANIDFVIELVDPEKQTEPQQQLLL